MGARARDFVSRMWGFESVFGGGNRSIWGQTIMFNDTSKSVDLSEIEATVSAIITGERQAVRRTKGAETAEPEMPFEAADQTVQYEGRPSVKVDRSRDALLTEFGKATLTDRYLMPGESFQDL